MKILLSGGTGFIGRSLLQNLLQSNHEVLLLTRDPNKVSLRHDALTAISWDAAWESQCHNVDAVINLSGEGIATKRWSSKQKAQLISSRLATTRKVVNAIKAHGPSHCALLNASAVGYYGNVMHGEVLETHAKGSGFLAEMADAWEKEALALGGDHRIVLMRIGLVLEKMGGALSRLLPLYRIGMGGPVGSGQQWMSWIHRDDAVNAILHCLNNEALSGPVNLTAPKPERMNDFSKTLARVMKRPNLMKVNSWVMKVGMGQMSQLVLEGQCAIPKKLKDSGYQFRYSELERALKEIVST